MSVLPSPERLVVHPGGSDSEKPAVSLIRRVQPRRTAAGGLGGLLRRGSQPEEEEPPQPAGAAASSEADQERAPPHGVPRAGFEPAAYSLGGSRSIQLSYRGAGRLYGGTSTSRERAGKPARERELQSPEELAREDVMMRRGIAARLAIGGAVAVLAGGRAERLRVVEHRSQRRQHHDPADEVPRLPGPAAVLHGGRLGAARAGVPGAGRVRARVGRSRGEGRARRWPRRCRASPPTAGPTSSACARTSTSPTGRRSRRPTSSTRSSG